MTPDTHLYISSALADDTDPVRQAVFRDIVDTVTSVNLTWDEYAKKLEARAGC